MYYTLFNAVTDAIELLEANQFSLALLTLEEAQKRTEEQYIEEVDSEP